MNSSPSRGRRFHPRSNKLLLLGGHLQAVGMPNTLNIFNVAERRTLIDCQLGEKKTRFTGSSDLIIGPQMTDTKDAASLLHGLCIFIELKKNLGTGKPKRSAQAR